MRSSSRPVQRAICSISEATFMEMRVRNPLRLITLLVLCFLGVVATPVSAQSMITLVQSTSVNNAGTVTSQALAFNSNNTSGNCIAVCIRSAYLSAALTVSDSQGNSYQEAIQTNQTTDNGTDAIYYAMNIHGGANTVTVTQGSSTTLRFAILEYSGVALTSALDVTAGAQGGSSSPTTGSCVTFS